MTIQQNTLYLTTPGSYISRDHLTLQVKVPLRPDGSPVTVEDLKGEITNHKRLSVPIHHLESLCVFGPSIVSPPALDLCWEHGVAVNYLSEHGHFQARLQGVADTSVTLRRAQFRAADNPDVCAAIARQIVAGKIQNSRNSLLRAARETDNEEERRQLTDITNGLARQVRRLAPEAQAETPLAMDEIRGSEGMASAQYFSVFSLLLKQQREDFAFTVRSRRPPRDRINCLLSFLYALVRHDCVAALASAGLDPFVGFLHADRPNRPSLALDLMEEFRPWLADRLAVTLVNRQQVGPGDFAVREGGAVEFTDAGRRRVIKAYQERKQESLTHPLLEQNLRVAQMAFIQARILARCLRGDLPDYVPLVPK